MKEYRRLQKVAASAVKRIIFAEFRSLINFAFKKHMKSRVIRKQNGNIPNPEEEKISKITPDRKAAIKKSESQERKAPATKIINTRFGEKKPKSRPNNVVCKRNATKRMAINL